MHFIHRFILSFKNSGQILRVQMDLYAVWITAFTELSRLSLYTKQYNIVILKYYNTCSYNIMYNIMLMNFLSVAFLSVPFLFYYRFSEDLFPVFGNCYPE